MHLSIKSNVASRIYRPELRPASPRRERRIAWGSYNQQVVLGYHLGHDSLYDVIQRQAHAECVSLPDD